MIKKNIKDENWDDLLSYIAFHEDDICDGINDFSELQGIFEDVFGRKPQSSKKRKDKKYAGAWFTIP